MSVAPDVFFLYLSVSQYIQKEKYLSLIFTIIISYGMIVLYIKSVIPVTDRNRPHMVKITAGLPERETYGTEF